MKNKGNINNENVAIIQLRTQKIEVGELQWFDFNGDLISLLFFLLCTHKKIKPMIIEHNFSSFFFAMIERDNGNV